MCVKSGYYYECDRCGTTEFIEENGSPVNGWKEYNVNDEKYLFCGSCARNFDKMIQQFMELVSRA